MAPTSAVAGDPARVARSEAVLGQLLRADSPGCSAAVGVQAKVVWAGARGVADLATGAPLTAGTVFDIGSVSKQFTATAILLLAGDGDLSIDDTVSAHLSGLPAWAGRVSIAELMQHTSGIPDFEALLVDYSLPPRVVDARLSQRITQAQTVQAIAAVPALRFEPGQRFEYSNSNYVLLAEIVRGVSGTPLPQFLRDRIFEPYGLAMVMNPDGKIAGKTMSYLPTGYGAGLQIADFHWEALGPGGIQTTASELVRWGDNYRTGKVGGGRLLQAQMASPVDSDAWPWAHGLGTDFTYAAGVALAGDATLVHTGGWEGFRTAFEVSPDRRTAIAVTCNARHLSPIVLAAQLRKIWT